MFRDNKAFSGFSVNDLAAAQRFYGHTLGLEVEKNAMGLLRLYLAGGHEIIMYPKDDHVPATYTILNFVVDDIDKAVQELKDAGLTMEHYDGLTDGTGIARGRASGHGPDIAWFKDPAGNILSVLTD